VTAPFFAAFGEGEIMDLTVIIACTSTIINSVALFRIFNVGARSFKFLKLGGKQWGNFPRLSWGYCIEKYLIELNSHHLTKRYSPESLLRFAFLRFLGRLSYIGLTLAWRTR